MSYNDQSRPFGFKKVSIKRVSAGGGPGVATTWGTAPTNLANVVLESGSVNRPLQSVEVRDESANPTDSFGVPGFVTGSAVAQIAKDNSSDGSSGILPTDGFTLTLEAAIGPEHFVITDVGQPYAQLDYFKQTISFKKLYGPASGL